MMRSLLIRRAAAAAALLALPVSLAACSSHKSDTTVSSATAHASTSSRAPSGNSSGDGSTEDGKPSKAQVAAGMSDYFVAKGVPRSLVNDVSTCVADKGYTQFSDRTLRALQQAKVSRLNPLDAGKLAKVTTNCLTGGKSGSLPGSAG